MAWAKAQILGVHVSGIGPPASVEVHVNFSNQTRVPVIMPGVTIRRASFLLTGLTGRAARLDKRGQHGDV